MKALQERLPSYMVPYGIINLPTFPITHNGKRNNQALKELAQRHIKGRLELSSPLNSRANDGEIHPLSLAERVVISAWSACLGINESDIPLDNNFLSCGGDSIGAISATNALRRDGFNLKYADFLRLGTVREQTRALSNNYFDTNNAMHEISYHAFELIDSALKDAILTDCMAHGYQEEVIEDAYLCTPLVSGLISLSVNHPHVS